MSCLQSLIYTTLPHRDAWREVKCHGAVINRCDLYLRLLVIKSVINAMYHVFNMPFVWFNTKTALEVVACRWNRHIIEFFDTNIVNSCTIKRNS